MLHHVSIEVAPVDLPRFGELLGLLGFEPAEVPPTLGDDVVWFERLASQVHLIPTDRPAVPSFGHAAFVVADYGACLAALREAGFEVEERREHWGAKRAFVTAPGGQRLEIMEFPPGPAS